MSDGDFPVYARLVNGFLVIGFYNDEGVWINVMSMSRDNVPDV